MSKAVSNKTAELFPGQALAGAAAADLRQSAPLAERMRPQAWADFAGLERLDQSLISQLKSGSGLPPNLILWGPAGCGKTTFARLVGRSFGLEFVEFSAVLVGVKEIREVANTAKRSGRPILIFLDEIHRLSKSQQDVFLPHVEDGTLILIGATTENPSFCLTSALLSRSRVITFNSLEPAAILSLLSRAAEALDLRFEVGALESFASQAAGDARQALNLLEAFKSAKVAGSAVLERVIAAKHVEQFLRDSGHLVYDRRGENHYNMISAFIKSMRGSDPDAALYWCFRMLEAGEDPRFIIRRMVVFASEDVGNADPRAMLIADATSNAYERLGLPEGRIPIAQCVTYLACALKSNRSYMAMHSAIAAVKAHPQAQVPLHLRNAPTGLMKSLGYGDDYRYPHDFEGAKIEGEQYLPDELRGESFYHPSDRGYEKNYSVGRKG